MFPTQALHPNIRINDITDIFRNSATRLRDGQLVKDEAFTLFEAVSAVEIGDPKMDSGSLTHTTELERNHGFETLVEADHILWLMDELLYREVAWHMGYPLSQTVFTSVHIERLLWPEPKSLGDATFLRDGPNDTSQDSLLHAVFRPYCLGLIKCCDLVLDMITRQHYYEEEDFATQIFNRPLLHKFSALDILESLHKARLVLEGGRLDARVKNAIEARLVLRTSLLELLLRCSTTTTPSSESLLDAMTLLQHVEETTQLGIPLPGEVFTMKIQHRLASSVPPRPMVVIDKHTSFAFLSQLMTDMVRAFEMLSISGSNQCLVAYQTFMAQTPQPAVYVRALFQHFLTADSRVLGGQSVGDFLLQDINLLVCPACPLLLSHTTLSSPAHCDHPQLQSQLSDFVNRCGQSLLNIFRTYCLNRSRTRRTMCHAALEWDHIQAEAEEIDTVMQSLYGERPVAYPSGDGPTFSYSLSSWVYHYKLLQLEAIVQMGFELSIYACHEHASMYWYLAFLTDTHLMHLERIKFFVSRQKQFDPPREAQAQTTIRHLYFCFTWLKATETLAKTLHRLHILLQRRGHFPYPHPTYSSDRLRYELRTRPFAQLSIPEPPPAQLAQHTCRLEDISDERLLEQASQLSQAARKAWEEVLKGGWRSKGDSSSSNPQRSAVDTPHAAPTKSIIEQQWTRDVRNTIKSCIGTDIAIRTIHRSSSTGRGANAVHKLKVEMPAAGDRDLWHVAWPVPKISLP